MNQRKAGENIVEIKIEILCIIGKKGGLGESRLICYFRFSSSLYTMDNDAIGFGHGVARRPRLFVGLQSEAP